MILSKNLLIPLFSTSNFILPKSFEIDVLLKFDIKGYKIDKLPNDNLVAEYQKSGSVKIGVKAQKGLTSPITGLKASKFTILYPGEAKVCAS